MHETCVILEVSALIRASDTLEPHLSCGNERVWGICRQDFMGECSVEVFDLT